MDRIKSIVLLCFSIAMTSFAWYVDSWQLGFLAGLLFSVAYSRMLVNKWMLIR